MSPPQTPEKVIEVDGVNMVFKVGKGEAVALQDANLAIEAGDFVSLIGPSGCGKTTLMRLVADLVEPTSGDIRVAGKTPRQAREDREYGYVFQAPVLYEWRTVLANVTLPLEIMGFPKARRRARARELLEMVDLQRFERSYPWQLSGGMQQRVSIARALAFDPKLLLMDEPFGALDEITREAMNLELLRLWQQDARTVVFVTHDIEEALFVGHRVLIMTARPARVAGEIEVPFEISLDPHVKTSPEFQRLRENIMDLLISHENGNGAIK